MPREVAVISDVPVTRDVALGLAPQLAPGGQLLEFPAVPLLYLVDLRREPLLTIGPTRALDDFSAAAASLKEPGPRGRYWTDLLIPYSSLEDGQRAAANLASAVGGTVQGKW
ncbi:hypothetical protein DEO23_12105 [Brachybacterium endophyticum]|uniref:Uncharacterized protein n=1 Tax=Brachybacterium endophyticum TaxID=2182385 RepID=A0A2U2RHI4_9MICO|nr:hypothetical protein [Brachybacterium endophyticum]PWH05332.1 hypothetical protein DEO23_12105 [Brachybacterium endophyticum]